MDDVDFIVGALLEVPEDDALVGNTSRCIIGDFFYRSRVGDRFFYDNDEQLPVGNVLILYLINKQKYRIMYNYYIFNIWISRSIGNDKND